MGASRESAGAPAGTPESETRERTFDPNGWRAIDSAPKDGNRVQLWHVVHLAPISCRWSDKGFTHQGRRLNWIEASSAHAWPEQAFSHWRPLPPPPSAQPAPEPNAHVLSEAEMDAMAARARAATPGPWRSAPYLWDECTEGPEHLVVAMGGNMTGEMDKDDADYVACVDPQTVLTLLAMARRAAK